MLADFSRAFRQLANDLFPGKPVHGPGAQPTWRPYDLTEAENTEVWDHINRSSDFWYDRQPLVTPGEVADLWAASRQFDIKYVTARHSRAREQTERWLKAEGLPPGRLTLVPDKVPTLSKVADLRGFLDDSPAGVKTMDEASLPVYVRDWPYNRGLPQYIPRVHSVTEFLHAMEPYHNVR